MHFRTEVKIKENKFLTYQHAILLMGSCFSENIGKKLAESRFNTMINPFGILYHPLALSQALNRIIKQELYSVKDLLSHHGLFHSPDHHGVFSGPKSSEVCAKINQSMADARQFLIQPNCTILITWGTSMGYFLHDTNHIAGNCHKLPAGYFHKKMSAAEEISANWSTLLTAIWEVNPTANVIFSISPVRHWRDGSFDNQLSKSNLFIALNHLMNKFPQLNYFPAYEIVMDELRDYRYYADDMLHPSSLAVDYIWEKFLSAFFYKEDVEILHRIQKINNMLGHRPLHPESQEYLPYLQKLKESIAQISSDYPWLDLAKEQEETNLLLKSNS